MKMITERLKFADVFPDKAASVAQRLHIKKDEIAFVRKYYTAEKDKTEVKKKERAVISYISTGIKDRDGEKLMPEGVLLDNYQKNISTGIKDRDGEKLMPEGVLLDNYQKNPIVPFAHDYRTIPPAKNMWIKRDEKGLVAKTVFAKNQRADDIYQAYSEDIAGTGPLLNAFSVGFIPLEWEDTDKKAMEKDSDLPKRTYNKWELLEYSLVPIPSCPEALTIAVEKGLISDRLKKDLEIEVVKDEKDREIEITIEDVENAEKIHKAHVGTKIASEEYEEVAKELSGDREIEVELSQKSAEGFFLKEEQKAELVKTGFLNEKGEVVITKPETTENYHRIPVNTSCKITATITISAKEGIKALYCGTEKKIHTYLFDVNKWTMEEAQAWVDSHKEFNEIEIKEPQHKERWNKSLSKLFDISNAESSKPLRFHYDLYEKFLECKVKEIFQNGYVIPSPLLGTYLAGFKEVLGEFDLKDTRKFVWDGSEVPPDYEVISLNSKKSDDFLISGMCFYEAEKKPLIVNFSPGFYGMTVTLTTSNENKEWNKELLDKVHSWVYENNFLIGEKFSLSGEFLKEPDDNWDNLILDEKHKDSIRKSANFLAKKGKAFTGRGLLFIGPPGTGKTKTGRVLMNELDATFIWVSSKDFRHIGPLRALALGFSLARSLAPAVLFLEDIDTWLRGEMEYVTDLIKTEMDGIKQNRGIITILTSNYPEKLPDALLDRPGRFHHIVNFELPKAEHRKAMLKLWAGDIDEDLLKEITEKTDGFSGAHIKELVEFAKMIAEEDEIEIGKALIMSLDKLMEQRELIEEIRGNQVDTRAVWGRVKYEEGEVKIMEDKLIEIKADEKQKFNCECIKCGHKLTSDKHCNEIKCPKCGGEMRRAERPGPGRSVDEFKQESDETSEQFRKLINDIRDQLEGHYELVIKEKDEIIAELKEGRVLSRKHREVVKKAVSALNEVLKADATGSREDEESESGTVTEREVEVVKDGEREFSKEDIVKVVKEVSGEQMGEILEDAFKNTLEPEKIKSMVSEAIRLELQKLRGKVV